MKFYRAASLTAARSGFEVVYGTRVVDVDFAGGWYYGASASFDATDIPDAFAGAASSTPTASSALVSDNTIEGNASVVKVPYKLEATWRVNLCFDPTFTYELNAQMKQILGFWRENERLHITQRNFPHGEWETPVDVHSSVLGNVKIEYDSHTALAVSVCPQTKKIFIIAGMHSEPMYLGISNKAGDINSGFTKFNDKNIIGHAYFKRLTYPSMNWVGLGDDCKLVIYQRDQKAGSKISRFKSCIFIWDHNSEKLRNVNLNTGMSLRLYTGNLARCEKTGNIYLSCIWRDESQNHPEIKSSFTKRDLFEIHSPNGIDWYQHGHSEKLKMPLIWNENGKNYKPGVDHMPIGYDVPVKIWDTTPNGQFHFDKEPDSSGGQGSLEVDGSGNPYIINSDRKTHSDWLHRWNGSRWVSTKLGLSANSIEPLRLPDGSMGLLVHNGSTVSFVEIGRASGNELSDGGVDRSWSVIPDHGAVKYGWLSYVLSKTGAASNDQYRKKSRPEDRNEDAYVVSIPLSDLKSMKSLKV